MKDWSAKQYLKFEDERTRPARDLAQAVCLGRVQKIVDIGCGPGNSTEILKEMWPEAEVSGFDSSLDMIEKAKLRLPNVSFEVADITQWKPEPNIDLLFSNAVFQWLPNHMQEMQRLLGMMDDGAVLAIQMPDNLDEATHRIMVEVAKNVRWKERIGQVSRKKLPSVSTYYDAFVPLSSKIEIWHTIYNHVLEDHEAIVEWVKGTGLRPFLEMLTLEERALYLSIYLEKIKKAYPLQVNGKVLLRFYRIFLILTK